MTSYISHSGIVYEIDQNGTVWELFGPDGPRLATDYLPEMIKATCDIYTV